MAAEAVGFIHDSPKVCGMEILLNGCRGCGVYT